MRLADWRAYRDQFKSDVLEVEARLDQPGLYDEINKALLECRAFLFVSSGGWAVLQPIEINGEKAVHILFVKSARPGILVRHTAFVVKMAEKIGARYLTASTKSDRAMMAYGHFGFKLESTVNGVHFLKKTL